MTRTRFAIVNRARCHAPSIAMLAAAAALLSLPGVAHAGLPDIAAKASAIATWLATAGLSVLTGATLWTGFKVLFRGMQFEQVSNLFWGGLLIGGAALFAAWFIS